MGLNLTKQTKLDFVDFLCIKLSLDWSAQMRWDKKPRYRGLNIVVKNISYHEFNYGLIFLIFLICLVRFIDTRCNYWVPLATLYVFLMASTSPIYL